MNIKPQPPMPYLSWHHYHGTWSAVIDCTPEVRVDVDADGDVSITATVSDRDIVLHVGGVDDLFAAVSRVRSDIPAEDQTADAELAIIRMWDSAMRGAVVRR